LLSFLKKRITTWETMLTRISTYVATNPRFVRQFLKFAVVGAIGAVVDMGVLVILKEYFGLNVYLARAISFTCAVLNNYTLNQRWTFSDLEKRHSRQLVQFFVVSVIGLGLNLILMYIFHGILGLHYLIATCLAILIVLIWNFFANRFWTFKE
jgi:putative flippase GtrA